MWLPDGKHLVVIGYDSTKAFQSGSVDWWLVSTADEKPVRLPLRRILMQAGLNTNGTSRTPAPSVPGPGCWLAAESSIVFATGVGDATNIWAAGFSMTEMALTGKLSRKTTGAGNEWHPSCSGTGNIAFTNLEDRRHLYSAAGDFSAGRLTGQLTPLTSGTAWYETPAISPDEHGLAFAVFATRSRAPAMWLRDLRTGGSVQVAPSQDAQRFPAIDHVGRKVAFTAYEAEERSVYIGSPESVAERVCRGCFRATDWSWDDKTLLICTGSPYHLELLDLASRQREILLANPHHHLMYGRFSPDNQWVSFTKRLDESRGAIFIARVSRRKSPLESEWISIATVGADDWANWSVDGHTIYYSSNKDGHSCFGGRDYTRRPDVL
jgi:Tol biopolymer transport system component